MLQRSFLLWVAVGTVLTASGALAQQPKASTLTVHRLDGGAFWLSGGSANTGFFVGNKGVIVIDTQISPDDARLAMAEIRKVTAKPVDTVIVSHGDPGQIGGLAAYPIGATIIQHEATPPLLRAAVNDDHAGPVFGPLYREVIKHPPTRTIGNTEAVDLDGVRVVLLHIAPAHTAGDLVVYLPAQKTVFAADVLLTNQPMPVIHIGGSSLGWIATMKAMLALDADTYVPGHGLIEPKAKLEARLRDVEQRREQIKAMVGDNRPLAEIEKAYPEQPSPFPSFASIIYSELTTGYPPAMPPWAGVIRP